MNAIDLLRDSFGRIAEDLPTTLEGLTHQQLLTRVGPEANTIAWLIWHLTRVQDDHVSDVAGTDQVWTAQDFAEDFALPFDPGATGWSQSTDEVGQIRASGAQLSAYFQATHAATLAFLDTLTGDDLDRIVDTRWDPPVSLGVRLVSVVNDDTQHLGQAAFIRGLLL
jgi:uncharacterized damage-inducible protein DinB